MTEAQFPLSDRGADAKKTVPSPRFTMREALELVRDCSSQEWQQPDGKRMAATDNEGRRFWFITEDVMQAVHSALDSRHIRAAQSITSVQQDGDTLTIKATMPHQQ